MSTGSIRIFWKWKHDFKTHTSRSDPNSGLEKNLPAAGDIDEESYCVRRFARVSTALGQLAGP